MQNLKYEMTAQINLFTHIPVFLFIYFSSDFYDVALRGPRASRATFVT